MKRTNVTVYGIKSEKPESSGCGCGPSLSMGEMYEDLIEKMCTTDLIDHVDFNFVDVKLEGTDQYPEIQKALDNGYKLPLTTIDNRIRFQSSIPFNHVFSIVKRLVN